MDDAHAFRGPHNMKQLYRWEYHWSVPHTFLKSRTTEYNPKPHFFFNCWSHFKIYDASMIYSFQTLAQKGSVDPDHEEMVIAKRNMTYEPFEYEEYVFVPKIIYDNGTVVNKDTGEVIGYRDEDGKIVLFEDEKADVEIIDLDEVEGDLEDDEEEQDA